MLLYYLFQLDPSIEFMFLPNCIFNMDLSALYVTTSYLLDVSFYS
jgi:hypothetical protein